jgi:hypothetical protein
VDKVLKDLLGWWIRCGRIYLDCEAGAEGSTWKAGEVLKDLPGWWIRS